MTKNQEYYQKNKKKILQRAAKWRKENKEYTKQARRKYILKRLYDISEEEYNSLAKKQDGKCAICGNEEKLYVDHNHGTGKVRGLLCNTCNTAIGMVKENTETLLKAITYLKASG